MLLFTVRGGQHHGMQLKHRVYSVDASSSVLSSDVESVSVVDSEDTCSRSAHHGLLLITGNK